MATNSAQRQATTTASVRLGPAATVPFPRCGARNSHGVGGSTWGQLGCLVTAVIVGFQFAAAAAPSSTTLGAAALARKPTSRLGSSTAASSGTASSTSRCTATAAPLLHPAGAVL